ncbi:histidine kinase [Massilia sp. WF1]|uniref:sensor histidine kinase n=1 Tax=unclassified Massilia TaxID=2609279 RepID=UPI00064A6164|nr:MULTISPECIES: HAMP domain-containing sensor histidine kinase [unclassified Massilia]ALK95562.1 histidine kinase [Massilia sp. WG5]KLU37302.1 histidine kinase [Massilia sp. WF1]
MDDLLADAPPDTPNTHDLFLFLASTAHDMKNSISVLSGTLEHLLAANPSSSSPQAEPAYAQMAHMLYQTKRLNDNLMQLLALYKQVGKPEYPFDVQPLELGQLVEQVVAIGRVLLKSRGIRLELDYDPQLIWHFDEDLVVGVLSHAINNAIHYTCDTVRLAIREREGWLELRVEDNGPGYPPSLLKAGAIATREVAGGVNFLTNSAGLGLYFSSEVAKMHRHRGRSGSLRLENGGAYGGGCFVLKLP